MPHVNRPVDQGLPYRSSARRLENLERKTSARSRSSEEEVAVWSHSGAVTVTTAGDEPLHHALRGGKVVEVSAHLSTAGSTSTVATFYLNGVSLGTVTLAASDTDEYAYLGDYRVRPRDKVGCRITTAGTGAKGFSAFLVMKG